MLIVSTENKKIKNVRKLLDKKYSLENKKFVIEGEHLVCESIKSHLLCELYVLEGFEKNYDFPYDTVSLKVMKSLSNLKSTPRVIGVSLMRENDNKCNKVVILEDIQDPGNAGTIIRSAVAFGVDTIVFSLNSVYPYNEKVIRSTQGMIFKLNIIIDDSINYISSLKGKNIPIIGTSLNTNKYIDEMKKMDKFAVVFGNEGNGVSDKVLSLCDEIYKIKMNSECESLNVAVSCGIILNRLYEE